MPCCCAYGCTNRPEKGFIMKAFPRDPVRRSQWATMVKREGWYPTNSSFLCEMHFEQDMWEKVREDGKRVLKWNAIPTLFSHREASRRRKPPKSRKSPKKKKAADKDVINSEAALEENAICTSEPVLMQSDAARGADVLSSIIMPFTGNMDDSQEEKVALNQKKELPSVLDNGSDRTTPDIPHVKTEIDVNDDYDEFDEDYGSEGEADSDVSPNKKTVDHIKNAQKESPNLEDAEADACSNSKSPVHHGSDSESSVFISTDGNTGSDMQDGDILPTSAVWIKEPATRYFCDICGQGFVIKHSITQHKRKKHGIHPYSCVLCSQTFPKKQDQLRHLQSHSGPDGFECEACPKVIPGIDAFLRHRKIHITEKNIPCLTCGMLFRTTWELRSHSVTHSDSRRFSCTECGQGFAVRARLLDHLNSHTGSRPYKCEICGKTFAAQSGWSNHCKLHTGRRPFKCEFCDRSFVTNANRRKHARTHSGEKRYECTDCHKKYSAPNSLAIHKMLHTGHKPYECDVCNASFRCSSQLVNHRRIHTGERPYTCDLCGSAFSQASNLNTHRKTHEKYQRMLDEKIMKTPVEHKKSQEQFKKTLSKNMLRRSQSEFIPTENDEFQEKFQKILSDKMDKLPQVEFVPAVEEILGSCHNVQGGIILEGNKDLSILPVIHLV